MFYFCVTEKKTSANYLHCIDLKSTENSTTCWTNSWSCKLSFPSPFWTVPPKFACIRNVYIQPDSPRKSRPMNKMLEWIVHFCIITFFFWTNRFVAVCYARSLFVKLRFAWRCRPFYEDKFPDFGKFQMNLNVYCTQHTEQLVFLCAYSLVAQEYT